MKRMKEKSENYLIFINCIIAINYLIFYSLHKSIFDIYTHTTQHTYLRLFTVREKSKNIMSIMTFMFDVICVQYPFMLHSHIHCRWLPSNWRDNVTASFNAPNAYQKVFKILE